MKTFDFQGQPIKYKHTGEGSPVILLHNGGTAHVIWREIGPLLSGEHELFAFDLLGYGASAKPGRGYTLTRYLDFLEAFIDRHRLAPVNLVGNCMGSAISLGLAHRRPEKVRAAVLINPLTEATFLAGMLGSTLRLRLRAPRFSRRLYGLLARIRIPALLAPMILGFQVGARGKSGRVHRDPELRSCFTGREQMRSLLGVLDDLGNYGYLDRLEPGTAFPRLCTVWGQQNKILSPKAGRNLNSTLKPQRQEWLEGCGHLLMLEQPDEVALIIRDFISGDADQPGSRRPGTEEG
ncbi:MAG: alpha/beta hydrolase [Firmicutes bacterium]|nr:alpha/beta hydrolase [Bacillota bacterium]